MSIEIWAEKYRPRTINDCILPKGLKEYFSNILEIKNVPNMLFFGKPGVGKTTVARALCEELSCNYLLVNSSDESGIDTFRGKIKNFATTASIYNEAPLKVVILDEADYLNANSTQPALRNFMEQYTDNCRFIATVNYRQRIIDALQSRMALVDFSIPAAEKEKIIISFFKRVCKILKAEGVEFDKEVLAKYVYNMFPDFRKTLVELQHYFNINKVIDEGILGYSKFGDAEVNELLKLMKNMNYDEIREWVAKQIQMSTDPNFIIRSIFDHLLPKLDSDFKKQKVILILGDYMSRLPFIADYEIHIMAMIVQIAMEIR